MNDNYIHSDNSVIYIVENIPGPTEQTEEYEDLMDNFNSQLTGHCKCDNICEEKKCSCLKLGMNYVKYLENGHSRYKLNFEKRNFETYPILECNSLCQCSEECPNRLVQRGPIEDLIINFCENKNKGLGLYSKRNISQGAFVCEYAGEILTQCEALKRQQRNSMENNMNYIYCLKEHSNGRIVKIFVDPSQFGNIGRYINHSCEPNSVILPVRVDSPIPKLAIFSCMDILPNTEITFDYGTYNLKDADLESSNAGRCRKKCLCMSKKCNGLIPFDSY